MRFRLAILILYGLGLLIPAALGTGLFAHRTEPQQPEAQHVVRLDESGRRGVVFFNHTSHESLISPDPNDPHKAKQGAACSGCHHTLNGRGIPQLFKCNVCHHRREGDPRNPKNSDFDEVMAERAFHATCIECHRASQKGPTICGGCHKAGAAGATVGLLINNQ